MFDWIIETYQKELLGARDACASKNISADYRTFNGWQSVEPYIRHSENSLQSRRELKGYFSSELVDFLKNDPDSPADYDLDPQPMVYCHNLEGLTCHITAERKVEVVDLLKLIEFGSPAPPGH